MKDVIVFEKLGGKRFSIDAKEKGGKAIADLVFNDIAGPRKIFEEFLGGIVGIYQGNGEEGIVFQGNLMGVAASRKAVLIWHEYSKEDRVCLGISEMITLCEKLKELIYSTDTPLNAPVSFEIEYFAEGSSADGAYEDLGGVY